MNILDFLQWVLETPGRVIGLVIIIGVVGLTISSCFPLFTINKKDK